MSTSRGTWPRRSRWSRGRWANPGAGARTAAESARPKGKALTEAIAAVIGEIAPDNPDGFNAEDKPAIGPLEKKLGFEVSPAERDAAWAAYRDANPDLFKGG